MFHSKLTISLVFKFSAKFNRIEIEECDKSFDISCLKDSLRLTTYVMRSQVIDVMNSYLIKC